MDNLAKRRERQILKALSKRYRFGERSEGETRQEMYVRVNMAVLNYQGAPPSYLVDVIR